MVKAQAAGPFSPSIPFPKRTAHRGQGPLGRSMTRAAHFARQPPPRSAMPGEQLQPHAFGPVRVHPLFIKRTAARIKSARRSKREKNDEKEIQHGLV